MPVIAITQPAISLKIGKSLYFFSRNELTANTIPITRIKPPNKIEINPAQKPGNIASSKPKIIVIIPSDISNRLSDFID